jgi:predicted RNase H-like HicB family nuclease
MKYAVIIEAGERNYSAYVPDLPGCIATGQTVEEVKRLIREGITLHLEGLREDGLPIPEPTTLAEYVEAEA